MRPNNLVPPAPFDPAGLTGTALEAALDAHAARVRAFHTAQHQLDGDAASASGGMRSLAAHLTALALQGDAPAPAPAHHAVRCAVCQDYGFTVRTQQLVPCVCRPAPLPGTPPRSRDCTFASFDRHRPIHRNVAWDSHRLTPEDQRQVLQQAWQRVTRWAHQPQGILVLLGPVGSGKTHLATAVGSVWRQAGGTGCYCAGANVLHADVATLNTTPLLILDDLGTEEDTPQHRARWITVLTARYTNDLPTVLTANRMEFELPERLADRVAEVSTTVVLAVESMRPHLRVAYEGGPRG